MNTQTFRVASAQYPIEQLENWDAYATKISAWVQGAVLKGAQLLVFPEYATMELGSLMPAESRKDLRLQLERISADHRAVIGLHSSLARQHNVYVLAGSMPVWEHGRFFNRAHFFAPDGSHNHQDKLMMTRFERETWGVSGGQELKVFQTELGALGVSICYDSEFPMISRRLCEAGADLILVPSCTETLHGYHRVRTGSRARALENQCYTVLSPLVGLAEWSEAIDAGHGAAGVFGPIDAAFPQDGVLAEGPPDQATWLCADLDLNALGKSRQDGQTLNARDWTEASSAAHMAVGTVRL